MEIKQITEYTFETLESINETLERINSYHGTDLVAKSYTPKSEFGDTIYVLVSESDGQLSQNMKTINGLVAFINGFHRGLTVTSTGRG